MQTQKVNTNNRKRKGKRNQSIENNQYHQIDKGGGDSNSIKGGGDSNKGGNY